MKGDTGLNLLRQLELRYDNVVYTLGYASSRREAKQMIRHNHFMLNGKRSNIPSMQLKVGDVIEVREKSRQGTRVMVAVEGSQRREVPEWLGNDTSSFKGEIKEVPAREHVTLPVEENMIVEFYSR